MRRIFRVHWCQVAERAHQRSRRQYAHVFHRRGVICVARAFWRLPRRHRLGVLAHEAGHVLAGRAAGEHAADEAAARALGITIRYRTTRWGRKLQYV